MNAIKLLFFCFVFCFPLFTRDIITERKKERKIFTTVWIFYQPKYKNITRNACYRRYCSWMMRFRKPIVVWMFSLNLQKSSIVSETINSTDTTSGCDESDYTRISIHYMYMCANTRNFLCLFTRKNNTNRKLFS